MEDIPITKQRCPSCTKTKMILDDNTGELFCSLCGFVVPEKIIQDGPEWRSFSNDGSDRSRVGAGTSITMHDMGLSTIIGQQNKDATGKPLNASMKKSIERLRTWDSRFSSSFHQQKENLRQALSEMDKMKTKLSLTDPVIEKAAYIYRKAIERKLVKGRSIHGLVAACIYAACRDTETPRTLDDVANGINIRRKDVARCYRLVFRELDLKIPVADPVKGVSRIASIAGLGEKTKRKAINMLNKAKKLGIVAGKDPMGIAAAALYLACIHSGGNKTQKEISIASGVN